MVSSQKSSIKLSTEILSIVITTHCLHVIGSVNDNTMNCSSFHLNKDVPKNSLLNLLMYFFSYVSSIVHVLMTEV